MLRTKPLRSGAVRAERAASEPLDVARDDVEGTADIFRFSAFPREVREALSRYEKFAMVALTGSVGSDRGCQWHLKARASGTRDRSVVRLPASWWMQK
ncbi:hypothetical protein CSTAT_03360 [Corynebacterium stationis]|nr:hypothetical protein CSTAT_03360 [Corynebacterium stationis]